MNHEEHNKLYEMNRRKFLQMVGVGGLAVASSSSLLGFASPREAFAAQAAGKNAEERAVNGLKALKAKMKGDTLSILHPSGSEGSMEVLKPLIENATGIKFNAVVMPMSQTVEKAMNIAVTKSSQFDVIIMSAFGVPDMVEAKLALDITNFAKKYNPEAKDVIPPLFYFGMYKGKLYAFNSDGDQMSLILRRDWLEDPNNQKAFQDKYGYPLKRPDTWDELFDQIKFFTNKDKQIYGAWLYTSPYYAKTEWMQLFMSSGVLPFDKDMHPQIAGPEGVKALEELIAIKPYLHPGCSTGGWSESYEAYGKGNVYAEIAWSSIIKYLHLPDVSKVAGKIAVCKVPGKKLANGMLLRPCRYQFGWTYVINSYGKNPEMAYLLAQYCYSPTITRKIMPIAGSVFDPFRYSHMDHEMLKAWDPTSHWEETKESLTFNIQNCYPELQLRGGDEYQSRLDENVVAAIQGLKKPEQALKDTAELWEKITDRYGRDKQKEQWVFLTSCFGEGLRKALHLPDPPAWVNQLG